MKKYDATIVLSEEVNPQGELNEESKKRLDRGISSCLFGESQKIMLTGGVFGTLEQTGTAHIEGNRVIGPTFSELAEDYAIQRGVNPSILLREDWTRDTAFQAITARIFAISNGWKNLEVVTSDYHVPRASAIFERVFSREGNILVRGIDSKKTGFREKKSLQDFYKTYEGIFPGDIEGMLKRTFDAHPLYNSTSNAKDYVKGRVQAYLGKNHLCELEKALSS